MRATPFLPKLFLKILPVKMKICAKSCWIFLFSAGRKRSR